MSVAGPVVQLSMLILKPGQVRHHSEENNYLVSELVGSEALSPSHTPPEAL